MASLLSVATTLGQQGRDAMDFIMELDGCPPRRSGVVQPDFPGGINTRQSVDQVMNPVLTPQPG